MKFDYDKRDVFKAKISPKLQEILCICNENHIPFFATFGVKMEDGKFRAGEGLITKFLLPEDFSIEHNDRCFAGFVNIVNGAEAVYPEITKTEEISADESGIW